MSVTLWSLKTYGYNCSKAKSYQIQRGFLPLFIFFPDLGLQAICLLILSFKPHAFKSFPLGCMPSGSLTKHICPILGSQICSNNLNLQFAKFLVNSMLKGPYDNIEINFFLAIALLQPEWLNTKEPYLLHPTRRTLTICMMVLKV